MKQLHIQGLQHHKARTEAVKIFPQFTPKPQKSAIPIEKTTTQVSPQKTRRFNHWTVFVKNFVNEWLLLRLLRFQHCIVISLGCECGNRIDGVSCSWEGTGPPDRMQVGLFIYLFNNKWIQPIYFREISIIELATCNISFLPLNCVLVKAVFMPIPFSSLLDAVYCKDQDQLRLHSTFNSDHNYILYMCTT